MWLRLRMGRGIRPTMTLKLRGSGNDEPSKAGTPSVPRLRYESWHVRGSVGYAPQIGGLCSSAAVE